jgi:hypothetical protein
VRIFTNHRQGSLSLSALAGHHPILQFSFEVLRWQSVGRKLRRLPDSNYAIGLGWSRPNSDSLQKRVGQEPGSESSDIAHRLPLP